MKILLVDADSRKDFPNLVLMKLSAWHKKQGNHVDLIKGIPSTAPLNSYDSIYISCLFHQNRDEVLDYTSQFPEEKVIIGGSGIDLSLSLDYDIEHIMPDYDLYDFKYSIGYTSRGCIRNCQWCVVPEKEGKIRDHAPISEFLDPRHDSIILIDNNFQASPRWRENLEFIREHDLRVNFNQGLDIRLVNEEFASRLSEIKFRTLRFNTRRVSFAFDSINYERSFRSGIEKLIDAGIKPSYIMVYVLVGFDSTFEEDLERVRIIRELDADPYIMRYNQTKGTNNILMHYSRYINWRVYKKISDFKEYDYAQSQRDIDLFFKRNTM